MNFCPHCGTKITDPKLGCTNCNPQQHGNPAPEPIPAPVEDSPKPSSDTGSCQAPSCRTDGDKNFSNGLKVLFVTISIIIPIAGIIFGIVASIILMTNSNKDHRSFGLALLILNIIMLIFFLFCCVFTGNTLLNSINIPDEVKDNFFNYIENAKTLSIMGM